MTDKKKFPRDLAARVLADIMPEFQPACERVIIAGSFRRLKEEIGDLEIVYIPKRGSIPHRTELFGTEQVDFAALKIESMLHSGKLVKRVNAKGGFTYGEKNKLMVHTATGLPVDFFSTCEANWHNYLVCRTGPAELNVMICEAAIREGGRWNPYGPGFTRKDGSLVPVRSEKEVFDFTGLPYAEPERREALVASLNDRRPPF